MFPLTRMTGLRLALISLICLALPAAASEREREIERLGHEFALTFQTGDIAAFAPLATASPVGNASWFYVTSILNAQRCIELVGEHTTILRADDATAFVLVDIASTARYIFAPDKTGFLPMQLTLHLRNGANGWRIEGASTASKELAIAFLAGEKAWSEVRVAEPYVNPHNLSYDFASRASGGGIGPERAYAGIDHAETLAREVHDEAMLALCDFSRARLAWAVKDFVRATQLGEAAVGRAPTAGDPATLGSALFGLAMTEEREHPDRAVADYTEALDMIEQFGNPRIGIASAINITDIRIGQRDYRGATVMAQRVLELSAKYRSRNGASNALSDLGHIHNHLRDFAVARRYYERSLEAAKSAADAGSIMLALQGVGGGEFELDELSASLEHLREALKYGSHPPSATAAPADHSY